MVVALLALALLQQAKPPELTVTLDRDEVAVGEEVLLVIRTRSASALPIEVRLGTTDGFVVVSRTEATSVNPDGRRPAQQGHRDPAPGAPRRPVEVRALPGAAGRHHRRGRCPDRQGD